MTMTAALPSFSRNACAFLVLAFTASAAAQVDAELITDLRARSIGPAGMSGRVAAIDVVESNPDTIYVGAASGGLWKSTNAGLSWTPIFDDQRVASIGAVAINQGRPEVVWVGTGEGNVRNSASVGNGIYRSLDGGKTFEHLGLEDTEHIHRIHLDPADPNVAFVAAMGTAWGENEQRGVFRTRDGGKSWQHVLAVDERTGCADLAIDPSNPDKLIAAMWDYRRWPWFFRSGGSGSGLYITVDGGDHWKRLSSKDGLPAGDLGRMGVAFCRTKPDFVCALVEAKNNVFVRSEDGGHTWRTVNADPGGAASRPFYYADIRVDPNDPMRVYSLVSSIHVSEDGAANFRVLVPFNTLHPDNHALWINPADPSHLIAGNDGGIGISHDFGETWRFAANLPLAQFYHINIDMDVPYNVYGGLQDNGSWRGPNTVWENGGVRNHHWEEVCFGDGFATLADPEDSMRGYAMSQQGNLVRWNLRTGERKNIKPPAPEDEKLRFNWNAGIALSPFDPATVYYGSQFLHRSKDRGDSWEIISSDLTTDNPDWQKQSESGGLTIDATGAENCTTIITIAPSPVEQGLIWVGSDDGRVHFTRDDGESWTSVEGNIPDLPPNTWCPHVEASRHTEGTAFAVFDDHRRANWTPYVYKTTDYGSSWVSLATDDLWGYVHVVEQDPVNPELLFLGTEFGLYFSVNGGARWTRLHNGLPTVAVRALIVHPRDHDLVIGTHGRAAYVIDDIRPLRELRSGALSQPLHLFELPAAQQYRTRQTGASRFPGQGEFRGVTEPSGAMISVSVSGDHIPFADAQAEAERQARAESIRAAVEKGEAVASNDQANKPAELKFEVFDSDGEEVTSFTRRAHRGLNRVQWNLRGASSTAGGGGGGGRFRFGGFGPEVLPGNYRLVVSFGEHQVEGELEVLADPRVEISMQDRKAKQEAIEKTTELSKAVREITSRIGRVRGDLDFVSGKASQMKEDRKSEESDAENAEAAEEEAEDDPLKQLTDGIKDLRKVLDELEAKLTGRSAGQGIQRSSDSVSAKIRAASRSLSTSWDAPNATELGNLAVAEAAVEQAVQEANDLFDAELPKIRTLVKAAGVELFDE